MASRTIPSKRSADAQEAAWVADEDRFALQQAKKKAAIRVRGGRARPIDLLAVTLAVIDPERNPLDDEVDLNGLDLVDPVGLFDGLDTTQLRDLEHGIDTFVTLERSRSNREYWETMLVICKDRRQQQASSHPSARGVHSVTSDLEKLLGPKSLVELETLEKQIKGKLSSNEPIDTDYWEHLLRSLLTYKAKAKLRKVSESILASRLEVLRKQQAAEAVALKSTLDQNLHVNAANGAQHESVDAGSNKARYALDPEPLLRLRPEDRALKSMTGDEFARDIWAERLRVLRQGYVPSQTRIGDSGGHGPPAKRLRTDDEPQPVAPTMSAFDREVARGLGENEEVFANEEPVTTKNVDQWAHKHRPRKPKYFNRALKGYEWNKYNQTHYDHDHPPPRVVQGYKFNVFYPDLVDKTKAPTYRIERENGRRRGQTLVPAGEDDTCVIRFVAGPPYEDIAFRIVDKEWDYSAKRERGFRSSFDKGILQLHFQFKRVYYRK